MGFDTIPAKDLKKDSDRALYVLVDVRQPSQYWQEHIPGAINIPYESIVFPMSGLDRRKTYVLYCDRGATSLLAARKLHEAGYNVLSIIGGLGAYQGPLAR